MPSQLKQLSLQPYDLSRVVLNFLNCPRSSVAERQRGYYYHSVVTVPKKKEKRTAALKDEQ